MSKPSRKGQRKDMSLKVSPKVKESNCEHMQEELYDIKAYELSWRCTSCKEVRISYEDTGSGC